MHDVSIDWDAAAERLAGLASRAQNEDSVITCLLADGCELLAYPVAGEGRVLAGLGLPPERAAGVDAAALLRRRGADPERYGAWLPARFEDGSLHLLRRWPAGAQWPGGAAQALARARELFDE